MITAFAIFLLLALLMLGVPVAFSLGIAGAVGLWLIGDLAGVINVFVNTPHTTAANYLLSTVPMFILMAEFASKGQLATQLFTMANRFLGHLPGGVAIATIVASGGFGAMCGSSSAAAAVMANISVPEMGKCGYAPRVSTGVVAIASTLAILIPPSIPIVIYGITTETSIGRLLIAGVLPGILTVAAYSIGIVIWSKLSKDAMPVAMRHSWRERWESLKGLVPFLMLVSLVIGGLYTGLGTPTELAAMGALATLIICLAMRTIDLKGILLSIKNTLLTTVMIFTIMIGAMVFGYFLTTVRAAQECIGFIQNAGMPPWGVLATLCALYLILGCFLDTISILLITLPLTYPLVTGLGYDGIWFGVITVVLVEMGLVTPPVGMSVYVVSGVTGVPLAEVFRGVGVLLCVQVITLILLLFFPQITLFLPSLMSQ